MAYILYSTAASHSLPSVHLFHPPSFPLSYSFFFFSYSPHLPSGEMVWPFWSKQALITPWEGIVRGTAQGIWRGPHRGTGDREIDAVGVRGVMAPYGMCTAPADGVSVSTLGKCVKDMRGGGGTLALGEIRCCKLEHTETPPPFLLQEYKEFTHVGKHKLMSHLSWIWKRVGKKHYRFSLVNVRNRSTVYFHTQN